MADMYKGGAEQALATLQHAGFLSGFTLGLFKRSRDRVVPVSSWHYAGAVAPPPMFNRLGKSFVNDLLSRTDQIGTPQVARTRTGLYGFAVPIDDGCSVSCIVGCGVRDACIDLVTVENMARESGCDPVALLEELEALPVVTFGNISEVAARIMALIKLLQGMDTKEKLNDDKTDRLRLVGEITSELDRVETYADVLALLSESLGLIFDLPGVAVIRSSSTRWHIEPLWGIDFAKVEISAERAAALVAGHKPHQLAPKELAELLPEVAGSRGGVLPLTARGSNFGALLLLGDRFPVSDLLLQDLLVGRGALRLASLSHEQELVAQNRRTEQLFDIFNQLALIDDVTELSKAFLDKAAELVAATSGSLMLLDSKKDILSISAVRGMNPALAGTLTVRVGSGIAGQVAQSGTPLLVRDIATDGRFMVGRRPRFKSGSFVSVPLCWKEETLGVLNLSDKVDNALFDQADLDLLTALAGHTASLVFRARASEGIRHLELLSVTDPLTELYNRRFLERRMEEELARSSRHGLKMSVMMLDMDSFKLYNDLCGHQAGDRALKQVADILCRSVREMDIVTRYGGEEFCILLPDTPKIDAMYVAERIRYGIEQELFPGEESLPLGRMTISIGVSSFPDNGSCASDLVSAADVALYQAKAAGRNRIISSYDMPGGKALRAFNYFGSMQTH
ncbi:sensor domain-containing diguanylate cyclase [Geobacter pelophilus]|uniref:diguanylate cyclase n=1 Tax=Geoanaerobacter pelophilus TaxID=60036 RepID=A0AAW4L7Y8_9BACT|nr:sensor domain-containing diguanylate cyclase [Geoanaerobacter pelophilus]MBT0666272.1 sensor domain-containing diguanylate cyclase [Geoanaerobacter pelophilus]